MLSLTYFKPQIKDELDGGAEYIKLAIELKSTKPQWSKTFYEMSTAELGHAVNLFHIAEEYFKYESSQHQESSEYIDSLWEEVVNTYTRGYAKVKAMQDSYTK